MTRWNAISIEMPAGFSPGAGHGKAGMDRVTPEGKPGLPLPDSSTSSEHIGPWMGSPWLWATGGGAGG